MRLEDKIALDRLQAALTQREGRKVTQEELLRRLVALGTAELRRLTEALRPASPAEIRKVMALARHTGRETKEEDIDRDLYGLRR